MTIRIGSAASPRWYDLSASTLERFIDALAGWGATSTELVLHSGDADEHTARVHILEPDWDDVSSRFQTRGFVCQLHAPLHPRFRLDHWQTDRASLQCAFLPVLNAVNRISARQPTPAVLVVHAASNRIPDHARVTNEFVEWASERLIPRGARVAIELRKPSAADDRAFDRDRKSLAEFVRGIGDDRVGICWDLAHDWESGRDRKDWRPEPSADFLRRVLHVHLHGNGRFEGKEEVHFPLQAGEVPWREMLSPLIAAGYDGAMTIEARYRFARALGEPWPVLHASIGLLSGWLADQTAPKGTGATT
jgi:sugar phosphate isomerase/epimerase